MNHAGIPTNSMSGYSPKEYWANIADDFRSADPAGIAPVLHPGAPAWFNQLIDKQQFHALRRALALATIPTGARTLDVGCGTGRWIRRYEQLGPRCDSRNA
jgi:SAM-dependent methyltransferase